jgi:hypothetical protein
MPFSAFLTKPIKHIRKTCQGQNYAGWSKVAEVSFNGLLIKVGFHGWGNASGSYGGRIILSNGSYIEKKIGKASGSDVWSFFDIQDLNIPDAVTVTKLEAWAEGDGSNYCYSYVEGFGGTA